MNNVLVLKSGGNYFPRIGPVKPTLPFSTGPIIDWHFPGGLSPVTSHAWLPFLMQGLPLIEGLPGKGDLNPLKPPLTCHPGPGATICVATKKNVTAPVALVALQIPFQAVHSAHVCLLCIRCIRHTAYQHPLPALMRSYIHLRIL